MKNYKDTDSKLHDVVKTLKEKGYTSITFYYNPAMSDGRTGWCINTFQTGWRHIGYTLAGARKSINELPNLNTRQ